MEVSVQFLVVVLFLTMTIMLFPMEFQQNFGGIPSGIIPGGSGILTISIGIPWKKWEFPWKWNPKWLRLQPNAFHRNSMEFCRILTFHWESGGIRRNSWRRVKTSAVARCTAVIESGSQGTSPISTTMRYH